MAHGERWRSHDGPAAAAGLLRAYRSGSERNVDRGTRGSTELHLRADAAGFRRTMRRTLLASARRLLNQCNVNVHVMYRVRYEGARFTSSRKPPPSSARHAPIAHPPSTTPRKAAQRSAAHATCRCEHRGERCLPFRQLARHAPPGCMLSSSGGAPPFLRCASCRAGDCCHNRSRWSAGATTL